MNKIINPLGEVENIKNNGRIKKLSKDISNAQIDPQGYFYKEE